jgi:hypothetical protein
MPVKLLNRKFAQPKPNREWEESLSIDLNRKYRPLQRLLGDPDLSFLRQHPAFRPEMEQRFRHNRLAISRMYLRSLATDFQLIQSAGRAIARHQGAGGARMLETLARREISFFLHMAAVLFPLCLVIVEWRSVDLTPPLRVVLDLQSDVRRWQPQRDQ